MTAEMSIKEFAKHRNVSKSQVYKYIETGLISKAVISLTPMILNVTLADQELSENLGARPDGGGAAARGSSDLQRERTRLTRINADRKELELAQLRGELIRTVEAMNVWGVILQHIVNKLESLPIKLPPLVHGRTMPEIKNEIEKMLYEIRMEMAKPDLVELAKRASGQPAKSKSKAAKGRRKAVKS